MIVEGMTCSSYGGFFLKDKLKELRKKKKRLIVGIEAGNSHDSIGGVVVEISGKGDDTMVDVISSESHRLSKELLATFQLLEKNNDLDSEDIAGLNFLMIHHINSLFQMLIDGAQFEPEDIDLIGIKCLEIGGKSFPEDPSVMSEMTGCVVASRFKIGLDNGHGPDLEVKEPILQRMVEAMIEKLGLEKEAREAVAVALLANEAIYHKDLDVEANGGIGVENEKSKDAKSKGGKGIKVGDEKVGLYGEFYFPA